MNQRTLGQMCDSGFVAQQLLDGRFRAEGVTDKASQFARSAERLRAEGVPGRTPVVACFVPGRVEVLGKHTDYAGGRSLVAAVERGFCVVGVARADWIVDMHDVVGERSATIPMAVDAVGESVGDWSNYPRTVARRVASNFPGDLRGVSIAFASDLPPAAGMSSSSALIVATFLSLSAVNDLPRHEQYTRNIHTTEELAGYLGTVENGQSFGSLRGDSGVGTFGGSEDHTAILCSRAGAMRQYSYCPVRFERAVPMPEDHLFVLAVSGVVAEKTGAARDCYNRASQAASAVLEAWCRATGRDDPTLASAVQSGPEAVARLRELLAVTSHADLTGQELLDRFEQFQAESEEIVPAVPATWTADGLEQFGRLVDRSRRLGAELLRNQVEETVFLGEAARRLGAVASSPFGAGFGGSVWAMVRIEHAPTFADRWACTYRQHYPQHATACAFLVTGAGEGAFFVTDGNQ